MLASLPFFVPVFPEKQKKRLILCSFGGGDDQANEIKTQTAVRECESIFTSRFIKQKIKFSYAFRNHGGCQAFTLSPAFFGSLIDFVFDPKTNVI